MLDICSFYYLAVEYYVCNKCSGTFIAKHHRIMEQLPYFLRTNFPVVLTHKYACDDTVIASLCCERLGNSPMALQALLSEQQMDSWLWRYGEYLRECQLFS